MVLVQRVDRQPEQVQRNVTPLLRDDRFVRTEHAVDLLVGVVEHDEIVERVPFLPPEINLHLREVVDPHARLERAQTRTDGHAGLEVAPHFVSARHDLVVDVHARQRADETEEDRPFHDRQQVDAAGPHCRHLAVGRQTGEHENARDEQGERNRPLHRLGEAHHREFPDERRGDAVQDESDDLDQQSDRQDEAQHEKREQEARQE